MGTVFFKVKDVSMDWEAGPDTLTTPIAALPGLVESAYIVGEWYVFSNVNLMELGLNMMLLTMIFSSPIILVAYPFKVDAMVSNE